VLPNSEETGIVTLGYTRVCNTPHTLGYTRVCNTPHPHTQGGYTHRCTPFSHPREAIPTGVHSYTHPQGGYTHRCTHCYIHTQGGYTTVVHTVIHTQGGYTLLYTLLYTPSEAIPHC